MRKIGIWVTAASVIFFVIAFLELAFGRIPGSCGGSECFHGPGKWVFLFPASILSFVGGVLMLSFGGRGYGQTKGPSDFAQVDSGDWAPGRTRSPSAARTATATAAPPARRWSKTWRNVYVWTGLGESGLALLFVLVGIGQPEARAGMFFTALILGAIGVIFLIIGYRAAMKDRLHLIGIAGQARILGLTQTGMWMNNNPYVRLDLEITVPGHPPYEVRHGEIVPQILLGRLTDGSTLPVKVDPNHPSHFVVEWESA